MCSSFTGDNSQTPASDRVLASTPTPATKTIESLRSALYKNLDQDYKSPIGKYRHFPNLATMATAYSKEQLERYLDYIEFPTHLRAADAPRDLTFLTTLHIHQISRIPYDNLSLHYSKTHRNSLDPQDLYDKFTNNGRGGYCMETTIFFRHVLRALGFRVYSAGARIRYRKDGIPQGHYIGWYVCGLGGVLLFSHSHLIACNKTHS